MSAVVVVNYTTLIKDSYELGAVNKSNYSPIQHD
jgi:hypothetical protein